MENRLPQADGQSRSEDQRNIKGIFSQLSLHDHPEKSLQRSYQIPTPSSFHQTDHLTQGATLTQDLVSDPDYSTGSDKAMLEQSRESFYKIAGTDVDVRQRSHFQDGRSGFRKRN